MNAILIAVIGAIASSAIVYAALTHLRAKWLSDMLKLRTNMMDAALERNRIYSELVGTCSREEYSRGVVSGIERVLKFLSRDESHENGAKTFREIYYTYCVQAHDPYNKLVESLTTAWGGAVELHTTEGEKHNSESKRLLDELEANHVKLMKYYDDGEHML